MVEARGSLKSVFEQIQIYFSGQHERQIVDSNGFSEFVHLEPNSYNPKDIPAKGITELDRLSYVVSTIEHQCQIVPLGSYKKTPLGEVKRNEAYRGRKLNELKDLSQYAHLRPVCSKEKVD